MAKLSIQVARTVGIRNVLLAPHAEILSNMVMMASKAYPQILDWTMQLNGKSKYVRTTTQPGNAPTQ